MNTIIVNLNDTIATNDTIIVKILKSIEACQPVINESETNSNDVWVVIAICTTVVLVVGLVAWVLYTWISGKNNLLMEQLGQRKKVNEAECRKQDQDIVIQKWIAEDKKAENELRRKRYQQETEQAKLDAEMERKIKEREYRNEEK